MAHFSQNRISKKCAINILEKSGNNVDQKFNFSAVKYDLVQILKRAEN